MGFPDHLIARKGDLIKEKWLALQRWVDQQELRRGSPDVRLTVSDHGTFINVETRTQITHPLAVNVSSGVAGIRPGTLNGDTPRIGEVRLDGLAMDYAPATVPTLPLDDAPKNGLSQVALRVLLNSDNEIDPEDPEALQIVHWLDDGSYTPEVPYGIQPLANLYWSEGSLSRVLQVVHHNLQHSYRPGEGERPGTHYFWGV